VSARMRSGGASVGGFVSPEPLSVVALVLNLLLGAAMSTIVAWFYARHGEAMSNRQRFARLIPMLSLTTILVISVIKASLALSLGLVGALSIVRFRTAIKDPEELLYLFLAIAIGLGLGVLFSAVDIFSPFSPVEIDREWRRGVDAVRMEYELSDTSSAEVLGVFGQTWEQSALLTRIRGYVGNMDGEILLGKRANDTILGGISSATLANAEVHAELAIIDTPEEQAHDLMGNEHQALMAVFGSSYTFDIGNGLTVLGEYLYNGLGVKDATEVNTRLLDPTFQTRVLRGDMQTLSQQALALNMTYPLDPSLSGSILVLQNPADASGLAVPSLSWDISADTRLLASLYLPWGEESSNGQLRSTYGNTPLSLFIQVAIYK